MPSAHISVHATQFPKRTSVSPWITAFFAAFCVAAACVFIWSAKRPTSSEDEAAPVSPLQLKDIPFNGTRAFDYLKQICAIGSRMSGSSGMFEQQKMLEEHFKRCRGQVEYQRFQVDHPLDGKPVTMANMIVRWNPERKNRILLCAHYDTLPYPYKDKIDSHGLFVGANDNAGGVALLMELAEELGNLNAVYGVDVVLFDGEEFVFDRNDQMFLGSDYFARRYAAGDRNYKYEHGVLLDMIADKDLQLYYEVNSMTWNDSRPTMTQIWDTAEKLGVKEFVARKKHDISDDHVVLHNVGKIPCVDLIDFDYPAWHTRGDVPEQCSALSLAKVGWTVREWLRGVK